MKEEHGCPQCGAALDRPQRKRFLLLPGGHPVWLMGDAMGCSNSECNEFVVNARELQRMDLEAFLTLRDTGQRPECLRFARKALWMSPFELANAFNSRPLEILGAELPDGRLYSGEDIRLIESGQLATATPWAFRGLTKLAEERLEELGK